MSDPAVHSRRTGTQRGGLPGRQAQAARNDQRILDSARAVFISDPAAPITAVAKHAGVGISALYTRYASKEELLRKLCADGLALVVAETEATLAKLRDGGDRWQVFADYMRRLTDADTSSLVLPLAGKFAPTPEMYALADHARRLNTELFAHIRDVLRPDVTVDDISLVFELVAAVKFKGQERTKELRHRYLALILDGLRATEREALPGSPPVWQDISERWNPDNK